MFALAAAALGLLAGSFLTTVIHRLPRMLEREWRERLGEEPADTGSRPGRYDLWLPRSHCPACAQPIPWFGLIPLAGFVLLGGRCAACKARISGRYPLVEILSAAAAGACAWHFGPGWTAVGACVVTWALIGLAFIDAEHHLLPDAITLPLLWAGLGFNLAGEFLAPLGDAVLGAMGGYAALWIVQRGYRRARGREGLGSGDLKLTAMLGGWLGWEPLPGIVLFASLGGIATGLVRGDPIAFGPWLALGGWLALVGAGRPLVAILTV